MLAGAAIGLLTGSSAAPRSPPRCCRSSAFRLCSRLATPPAGVRIRPLEATPFPWGAAPVLPRSVVSLQGCRPTDRRVASMISTDATSCSWSGSPRPAETDRSGCQPPTEAHGHPTGRAHRSGPLRVRGKRRMRPTAPRSALRRPSALSTMPPARRRGGGVPSTPQPVLRARICRSPTPWVSHRRGKMAERQLTPRGALTRTRR